MSPATLRSTLGEEGGEEGETACELEGKSLKFGEECVPHSDVEISLQLLALTQNGSISVTIKLHMYRMGVMRER